MKQYTACLFTSSLRIRGHAPGGVKFSVMRQVLYFGCELVLKKVVYDPVHDLD